MTTEFFIFGLARLTRICNPSTDSETSLKVIRCSKFSKKPSQNKKFFTYNKKEVGNIFKTGTMVKAKSQQINMCHHPAQQVNVSRKGVLCARIVANFFRHPV